MLVFFKFSNIKVVFCVWSTAFFSPRSVQDDAKTRALSRVISCHVCHFNPTFLNSFVCPHLPGLHPPPPPASLPFVPMWIFRIAAAAGAWCEGLSAHCVDAVWVLRYAAPWRVVCRDRRVAADASRPPACLSVRLHLTGGDIAKSTHAGARTHIDTLTYTLQHWTRCSSYSSLSTRLISTGFSHLTSVSPLMFCWLYDLINVTHLYCG